MKKTDLIQVDRNPAITWGEFCELNAQTVNIGEIEKSLDSIKFFHGGGAEARFTVKSVLDCPKCHCQFSPTPGNRFSDREGNFICEHCFLGIDLPSSVKDRLDDMTSEVSHEFWNEYEVTT